MASFLVHRLAVMVPIMILVGIICFFFIHLIPGNPAERMLGPKAGEEAILALTKKMGYDQPLFVQFVKWGSCVIRGDFGLSIYSQKPVLSIILHRVEPSLLIASFSLPIYTFLGLLFGIVSAVRPNSFLDQLVMTASLLLASIPTFWLGLNLMLAFAAILHWLPSSGYRGVLQSGGLGNLRYLVMPTLTVALPSIGLLARLTRSYALDIIRTEYITAARSKGLREVRVIFKHVLRNVLIPVIAVVGTTFASVVSLTVVTETVFNIPGIGRLVVESISKRDYPTLQAVLICTAGVYLIVNLLCDVAYALVDPRIQYN